MLIWVCVRMSGEGLIHISFARSISPGFIQPQVRCGLKVSGAEIWRATKEPRHFREFHLGARLPPNLSWIVINRYDEQKSQSYSWRGCSWWCPLARAPRSPRDAFGWAWSAGRAASCMWVNDALGFSRLWVTYSSCLDYCAFQILQEAEAGSRPGAKLRARSWCTEVRMTGRGSSRAYIPPSLWPSAYLTSSREH